MSTVVIKFQRLIPRTSPPDGYHSCYVLAGLVATQFRNDYSATSNTGGSGELDWAMHWISSTLDGDAGVEIFSDVNKLVAVHPIYVIPWGAVERCYELFGEKEGF